LGNTYVSEKKNDSAIKTYDQLISENRNGSYASKAMLRQGLIYYNADNDTQALLKFKKIASEFPKSPEALEAVATAVAHLCRQWESRRIRLVGTHADFVEVSDADLDNDTYEAAEKQFSQNNTKQAIATLSNYTVKFPNGIHSLKANFYLAQSYYADNQPNNAIPNYEFVASKARNEFTEQRWFASPKSI
jgi:TolA-binding protein